MRILLAHNSLYAGSFGGGDRSNRLLMEALAARGHTVRVIARVEHFTEQEAARAGVPAEPVVRTILNGVEVHTLVLEPKIRAYFAAQIGEFDPDVIITSTDDPAQILFEAALNAERARVVHLVRATIAVPFGPDSSMPSAARTDVLRRAGAIVGVSEYVAAYIRRYGPLDAVHVPISLLEARDWPVTGRFENRFVMFANPCAVKGIDIFLGVAEQMPDLEFAAVPTWGTTDDDLARLRRLPNVSILQPFRNIDDLLALSRVMLVPSVWAEARSRMVVEAMLGGVPVVASDAGGIREAKLGVPYLIPVRLVTGYRPAVDANMVPVAEVPPQKIEPWVDAVRRLTGDRAHWTEIAQASRTAALAYASKLSVEPFERLLFEVVGRPRNGGSGPSAPALSPDKQKLLAMRLRQRLWFPGVENPGRARLFCFPHAGAGALVYRTWAGRLGEGIAVCPALLPGRETRAAEPAFEAMPDLILALVSAIRPWLTGPFAFFGHSMGAGIAFELARALRRLGLPQPRSLHVSAARAPQLRLDWKPGPPPSDAELRAMIPEGGDPALLLPVLRADTKLYREYRYEPEPPLDIPIFAYGGIDDPNLSGEQIQAWTAQTRASFRRREFPGGHFYLREQEPAFLEALKADLQPGFTA